MMFEAHVPFNPHTIFFLDQPDPDLEGIWEIENFWQLLDWDRWYPKQQHQMQRIWELAIASYQQFGTDELEQNLIDLRYYLEERGWILRRYPRRPDPSTCAWDRCAVVLLPQPASPRKRGRPRNSPTIPWLVFEQLCDRYFATYHIRPTREQMSEYIEREYTVKGGGVVVDPQTLSTWVRRNADCDWATFWDIRMH